MTAFQRVALGSGTFEKDKARDVQRAWIQAAEIEHEDTKAIALATSDEMRTLGIKPKIEV